MKIELAKERNKISWNPYIFWVIESPAILEVKTRGLFGMKILILKSKRILYNKYVPFKSYIKPIKYLYLSIKYQVPKLNFEK